ncbi:histidine phosphatase family protein [Phyllobacterium salinisoli]|uniref:Histidine phosphatase family protein n=1 Tax=Phyllobacterium salinisoli TaxID=1899321 RepID=A0A368K497_9HYPH|nr:histidine phosphatase family protein [Phyllobacterium salinisoli]RCS23465.1 histidine phosphatase family protein [Phyllobacterium salinisoli]
MFHLLRHADHGHVGRILTGRTPDIHLSETGKTQAQALASHMAGMGIDALFSSPQLRARETAEFIAAATGLPNRIAPELDEIDFGYWAGQTFDALALDPDWRRWNADRETASTPAGETMSGVAMRFAWLVERLSEAFPGGSVCLVSHADVIKAGICQYLGRSFQEVHDFEIAPASATTLVFASQRPLRGLDMGGMYPAGAHEEAVH